MGITPVAAGSPRQKQLAALERLDERMGVTRRPPGSPRQVEAVELIEVLAEMVSYRLPPGRRGKKDDQLLNGVWDNCFTPVAAGSPRQGRLDAPERRRHARYHTGCRRVAAASSTSWVGRGLSALGNTPVAPRAPPEGALDACRGGLDH